MGYVNLTKISPARGRNQCGFTFLELIIVLILIGVLAGIAAPRFTGIDDHRLPMAADDLSAVIRHAQQLAMNHQPASVCLRSGSYYIVLGDDCSDDRIPIPGRGTGGDLGQILHDGDTRLTFNRLGGLDENSDTTVQLTTRDSSNLRTLKVYRATGYVEVQR